MPTIAFIQPKGGTGKSTSALVLATQLAEKSSVCLIDTDPNEPLVEWARGGGTMPKLTVIGNLDEETIYETIETAQKKHTFVIVDTEGTANLLAMKTISLSDLVIVPSRGSTLDQNNAAKAIRLIGESEKMCRRPIPYAVLFTCVSAAIRSKDMKAAEAELREQGIGLFNTNIVERVAFRSMFSYNTTLAKLDMKAVSGKDRAIDNSIAFASEVLAKLKAAKQSDARQAMEAA